MAPSPSGQQTEVIVIGGGQAGLVAGYYLSGADIPLLILDASARVGDPWRRRWDSLQLFTVARYSELPGLQFPGDPEHFPGKEEIADYLEAYARTFELPLRLRSEVTSLEPSNGGYRIEASSPDGAKSFEASQAIVATGAYQRPYVPPIAERLSPEVAQLHSADYRNPGQIPEGDVLVVGAANSGAGIAEDLASTHRVHLSRGSRITPLPRRILGKSLHWWGDHLGLIGASLESWRGRTQRGDVLVGQSLRRLARRHGVRLRGRAVDADGRAVRFKDGGEIDVDAVIWATGYRPDYSWIRAPVLDERGKPRHQRGVTEYPGLYFLGMKDQYSRGSSLIFWVKDDASYIVDRVRGARSDVSPRG
jgi:putative flavoprotein involved in K+ transport